MHYVHDLYKLARDTRRRRMPYWGVYSALYLLLSVSLLPTVALLWLMQWIDPRDPFL